MIALNNSSFKPPILACANMNTINPPKIDVIEEMGRAINPDIRIKNFSSGVSAENVDQFLEGVDAYVDGLDFFAFKARQLVFEKCHNKKIPATTVGPIGVGAALMNFIPGKMSFMDYCQWKASDTDVDLGVKFLVGITAALPHRSYVVDTSTANFSERRGPSTQWELICAQGLWELKYLRFCWIEK